MEDLRKKFEERLKNWRKKKGEEESKDLMGELMHWGSICLLKPTDTIWSGIKEQIEVSAQKTGKSEDELLNYLFESDNHDTWMLRFQMLDAIK